MDIAGHLSISYYRTIATINDAHKVYLVQHRETNRICVKKILDVYSIDVYQYLREHPITGIPQIIELCEENNTLTVIEEYISGSTLKDKISSETLTEAQIADYLINLCEILEHLHSHNPPLIHRDIKPSNIMITEYNKVVLLDFNAAKYHSTEENRDSDTQLLGTQGYAAPEQYGFGESSPQTDIYSLGVILREASAAAVPKTHRFDQIIDGCTRIDPQDRYPSAADLKAALLGAMSNPAPVRKESNAKPNASDSWLPPGFRTGTPWKMVIAALGYLFIAWFSLTLEPPNTYGVSLWMNRITLLFMMLGFVFIPFDYRGIQRFFPPCRSKNKLVSVISCIAFALLNSLFCMIMLIILEWIFFGPSG